MQFLANGRKGTIGKFVSEDFHVLSGDLSTGEQQSLFGKICNQNTVFLHMAAIVGNSIVEKDIDRAFKVNVEAVAEMGRISLENNVNKFIYVSSSHVYADTPQLINENSEVGPVTEYAKQKLEAEKKLSIIFSNHPDKLLIIRVFSILDWGMPIFTLGGAIEKLISDPRKNSLGFANDVRDFLTPKTVAKNLEAIAAAGNLSGIYNLCSGKGYSIKDAAILMAKNRKIQLSEDSFISNKEKYTSVIGDNSKLKSAVSNLDLKWSFDS
jgi:nucleoside-diphosphate-sugar epimerase